MKCNTLSPFEKKLVVHVINEARKREFGNRGDATGGIGVICTEDNLTAWEPETATKAIESMMDEIRFIMVGQITDIIVKIRKENNL